MEPFHLLRREQFIPRPRAEVFMFFERPENLGLITPARLGFRIITPSPVPMHTGALIDYTIRLAGLPVRWTTMITAHDPPNGFVDQQIHGPYDFWHHTHRFDMAPGGTQMTDEVRYRVGWGPFGGIARRLFVRPMLESIFDFRAAAVARILAAEGTST